MDLLSQVAFVPLKLSSYVERQATTTLMRRQHLDVKGVARQIMATNSKVSGEKMMWKSDLCAAHVCA